MRGAMRRVAYVLVAVIGVLAVWLTVQQVVAGSRYADDPRNPRARPADDRRGTITTADGVVVAEDIDGVRRYALGGDYLQVVGYDLPDGAAGLESSRAVDLSPLEDGSITSWLFGLFGGSPEPPQMSLTVVDALQQSALDGLAGRPGAVVAIDPRTGAVLAYASSPSLDPNDLVDGTRSLADLGDDPGSLDRAAFLLLPAGSTFKILVAAAALEAGMTPDTEFEDLPEYLAPGAGLPIGNAGGGSCVAGAGITLREALVVSCNTVFASLAVDLGGEAVVGVTERAGFNTTLPFELGAAISSIPTAAALDADPGALAQTGIGERDLRVTPLQMAVIVAGIGNGGVMMKPYVVEVVSTGDGSTIDATGAARWGRVVSPEIASELASMMADVVADGTGRAARRDDVIVAGKTGTAEGGGGPHAWFIGFAPADDPTIAIAVVVQGGGSGGAVAAPIAAGVFEAWFGIRNP
ncbi:MAG: hypothetical protein KKE89_00775 [Actinobacteria bacterium]|nr:hypothetical protein [Actinomycetota bacterium]